MFGAVRVVCCLAVVLGVCVVCDGCVWVREAQQLSHLVVSVLGVIWDMCSLAGHCPPGSQCAAGCPLPTGGAVAGFCAAGIRTPRSALVLTHGALLRCCSEEVRVFL